MDDCIRAFKRSLVFGDLKLRYQPIIDIKTGRVSSMEALLDWPEVKTFGHTIGGLFDYVESDKNLSILVDRYLLKVLFEDAIKIFKENLYDGTLSFNLSPATLGNYSFIDYINELLKLYSVPTSRLIFEITERNIWCDNELVKSNIQRLRAKGIKIAIDDFITGYANFGTLLNNQTDIIKLDRSVVQKIPDNEIYSKFCHSFIDLIHHVGKELVVEGVETKEQLMFFRANGYRYFQGYLFSTPLRLPELISYIRKINELNIPDI